MVREFKLPDVGEGVSEGEIVEWLVEVGDTVTEDQPVAEVETDKAVVDVPAPVDGTVREILAEEGEVVKVGSVIITFDVAGEESEAGDEGEAAAEEPAETATGEPAETATDQAGEKEQKKHVFAPPHVRRLARELDVDLATVDGSGPSGRVTESDVRAAAEAGEEPAAEPEQEPAAATTDETAAATGTETAGDDGQRGVIVDEGEVADREKTLAAPATRRVAEELGVDLDEVPADEERDGQPFVTESAVRAYAERQEAREAGEATATTATVETEELAPTDETALVSTELDADEYGPVEREPYRGIRRTIGEQMARSKYTAPHVTHFDDVDVTELVEVKDDLAEAAAAEGVNLTYTPFVVKAVTAALKEFPAFNASLDEEAGEILKKGYYNVGVATATDAGLMVPVVKNADGKGLRELAAEIADLAERARDRSISREEMQGGTFTITNVGAIGGRYATPVINYPEVGILALGAIEQRPRVVDGEVVPRYVLPLSLSFDHRVTDGAEAARFTNRVKEYLANPTRLLLE